MSDENLIVNDFSWDDEENVDLTPAASGKKHFAHLKMYILKVTKSFTKGDYVSIPGVKGGDMNEKDDAGNMKFKGWKEGGTGRLFVLVATQYAQDGSSYQLVKQYSNKNYDAKRKHYWAEMVYPALQVIDAKKLVTDGVYVEFSETPTGDTFAADDGDKDIMYWSEYKVYPDKDALDKANEEFFAQFKDNGTSGDFWPSTWLNKAENVNHVDVMVAEVKKMADAGESHKQIADKLFTAQTEDQNGNPVNKALVLSKCLDVPEPMIQL